MLLFSEARFQFQQLRNGRPGDLFGDSSLGLLERPWENGTTRDLLKQMELDATQSGNSYWVDAGGFLHRLAPEKVTILTEAVTENVRTGQIVGDRIAGYAYQQSPGDDAVIYLPDEVAHYAPMPDRTNRFRGMSWLSPCLPDIDADMKFTEHKRTTLNNGTQLGAIVSIDAQVSQEQFDATVEAFRKAHEGPENAGKTVFVAGGTDVKTVSQTFEQLSVKATQGAGETRIAACAGVPPVIVGLSEGLAGSSLNTGNYSQARRRLVDGTMRPLWGDAAGALETLVPAPRDARLYYDDRDIPFLREDVKDQAEILAADSQTLRTLIEAGYEPDAATDAVVAGDLRRLRGKHSGLTSVQLQPPSDGQTPLVATPS
jgi:phage portal protein BeeE